MIFNRDIIFIHIGKTGGMSCAQYLLAHLKKKPIFNCHKNADKEMIATPVDGVMPVTDAHRHWTLEQTISYTEKAKGLKLCDFSKVIAVIRHPFTLEYSFYHHLQKPHIRRQRGSIAQPLFDLADGDFKQFVEKAGYHAPGKTQDAFVRVDGEIPDKVELVKFEQLGSDFSKAVSPYTQVGAADFETRNVTKYDRNISDILTAEIREAIYNKHRYMFDSGLYSIDD